MGRLEVERLGGFAGFGSPGSHLRSRGRIDTDDLVPADRKTVNALFDAPPGGANPPDAFRYRLTRQTAHGPQTVEVPEQHVPVAVRAIVKDELV
jgi:emfourin